jgi:hypothetical protein
MKQHAKIIGLSLTILFILSTIIFSYPSILEATYTLGEWYNKTGSWMQKEQPDASDFKVHPWLSLRAIKLFDNTYGKGLLTDEQRQLIILGSIEEDYDLEGTSSVGYFADVKGSIDKTDGDKLGTSPLMQSDRSINHFMDIKGEGLHEGVLNIGASALDWATSDEKNLTRYSEALALVKSGETSKQKNGWRFLGHVLHLLEDMATPAHVRNDQHAFGTDTYEFILSNPYINNGTICVSIDSYDDLLLTPPDSIVDGTVEGTKDNNLFKKLSDYTRSNYYSDDSFNKAGYANPTLIDGGDGYCYNSVSGEPYKQGVAYYIEGKNCNSAKIDEKTVQTMFPDLASKAIAYGAGLIKLFYDASIPQVSDGTLIGINGYDIAAIIDAEPNYGEEGTPISITVTFTKGASLVYDIYVYYATEGTNWQFYQYSSYPWDQISQAIWQTDRSLTGIYGVERFYAVTSTGVKIAVGDIWLNGSPHTVPDWEHDGIGDSVAKKLSSSNTAIAPTSAVKK